MKTWGIIVAGLILALVATGVAEAWYPHGHGAWYGPRAMTTFGFGFNFVVPVYPYPAYPAGYYAPVFVPQCATYSTPGYYRQVPWYTDAGGFTTFRQEWVPPATTQVCR